MAALRVGPGTDENTQVGPLVNEDTVAKVDSLVKGAIESGATARPAAAARTGQGFYYPPTVLTGVRPDSEMRVKRSSWAAITTPSSTSAAALSW